MSSESDGKHSFGRRPGGIAGSTFRALIGIVSFLGFAPKPGPAVPPPSATAPPQTADVGAESSKVPTHSEDQDSGYLRAVLRGTSTSTARLGERDAGVRLAQNDDGFNDSNNPHPQPYSDTHYSDTGFGDRSDDH